MMRIFKAKYRTHWIVLSVLILSVLLFRTIQAYFPTTESFRLSLGPREHTHFHERATVQEVLSSADECASCPSSELKQYGESPKETVDERKRIDQACKELLREAAAAGNPNPNTEHLNGCRGKTPLHIADDPAHVLALIATGADPNVQDLYGNSPLHEAASRRKNPEIVRILLNAGANVDSRNISGNTPVQWMRGTLDGNQLRYSRYLMRLEGLSWKRGRSIDEILKSMSSDRRVSLAQLKVRAHWGSEIEEMLATDVQTH